MAGFGLLLNFHGVLMRHRFFAAFLLLFLGTVLAASGERKCSICGTVLTDHDKYYQVQGSKEVFCERCFNEAPRCRLCSLPTAPANIDPETGACSRCLAKLPRCKTCGKAIVGTYYKYPDVAGVFCPECKNTRPACAICGAPVGDRHWDYPDGRIVCADCGERAVIDVDTISRIMRDAQATVEKRLGLKVKQPYTLRVVKLSSLASAGAGQHSQVTDDEGALYGKELGLYRLKDGRSEIFLLFGLPPELLFETAAHEYAHAWQTENGLADLSPETVEGFAQWVAAEVLRARGYRGALEKLEARRDYPYGTGYQQLRALNQRLIIEQMRKKH